MNASIITKKCILSKSIIQHDDESIKKINPSNSIIGNSSLFESYTSTLVSKERFYKKDIILNSLKLKVIIDFVLQSLSFLMTIGSICVYIIQTCYEKENKDETDPLNYQNLVYSEIAFSFYFLSELILTILLKKKKRQLKEFLLSLNFLIDLLVIFPSIFSFFSKTSHQQWNFFRALRFMRLFRLYNLVEFFQSLETKLKGETRFSRNPIKKQFAVLVIVLICSLFMGAGFIMGIQNFFSNSFNVGIMNFFDALYFMVILCSTIGYGDITPTLPISRLFVTVMLFSIIMLITKQFSKIIETVSNSGNVLPIFKDKDHLILFASKSVNLESFLEEIRTKNLKKEILILSQDMNQLERSDFPFNKTTLMNYDVKDTDFIKRSNMKKSEAVFIFADKSIRNSITNDKFIDSLLIKTNKLKGKVPIYIQSLNSEKSTKIGNIIQKTKKKIPIWKLKSIILTKSLYNPGFSTFIQNLMFNHSNTPNRISKFSPLYKEYFFGSVQKIHVFLLPEILKGYKFSQIYKLIYFESLEFLRKKQKSSIPIKPFILIGLIVDKISKEDSSITNKVLIFPQDYLIKGGERGVFICKDDEKKSKLSSFFRKIKRKIREEDIIEDVVKKNNLFFDPKINNFNDKKELNLKPKSKFEIIEDNFRIKPMDNDSFHSFIEYSGKNGENELELIKNKYSSSKNILNRLKSQDQRYTSKSYKVTKQNALSKIEKKIESFIQKRFSNLNEISCNEAKTEMVNNRIIHLNENSNEIFFDHILIIGFQDNLFYLVNMITSHLPTKQICLLSNDISKKFEMKLILKHFNNVKLLYGNPNNPKILIKAGIQKCFHVILLCEIIDPNTNEDISNLVIFRSIEYYFNSRTIIELWDRNSINLIGNIPLDKNNKVLKNEFVFPNFMAGKAIYLNHFEKIVAESYLNDNVFEVWLKMIKLGEKSTKNEKFENIYMKELDDQRENSTTSIPINYKNDDNTNSIAGSQFSDDFQLKKSILSQKKLSKIKKEPAYFVTFDIPEEYSSKEYLYLIKDLSGLSSPVIPLGIYIEEPLLYSGICEKNENESLIIDDEILLDENSVNQEKIQNFLEKIKVLKNVSYNNKNFLEFENFEHNSIPLFITNPSPNFILLKKTKILVLVSKNLTENEKKNKSKSSIRSSRGKRRTILMKEKKVSRLMVYKLKRKLLLKQEDFLNEQENLKEIYFKEYNKLLKKIDQIA